MKNAKLNLIRLGLSFCILHSAFCICFAQPASERGFFLPRTSGSSAPPAVITPTYYYAVGFNQWQSLTFTVPWPSGWPGTVYWELNTSGSTTSFLLYSDSANSMLVASGSGSSAAGTTISVYDLTSRLIATVNHPTTIGSGINFGGGAANWIMVISNTAYYVDPAGSDTANGLSSATAWQHLVFAGTNKAATNCTIFLTSGATYNEGGILFTNPNVAVSTTGSGAALITNGSTALAATAILSVSNSGISLNNLHIRGNSNWVSFTTPSNGPAGIGLYSAGAVTFSNVTIQNCQVDQVVAGIMGYSDDTAVWTNLCISNCAVHDCDFAGIYLSGTGSSAYDFRGATIIANTVSNIYGQAARISGCPIALINASNSLVGGNTCHDSGISTTTAASGGAGGVVIVYSDYVTVASNECFAIHSLQPNGVDGLGVDLDTGAQNCLVEYNYVHDNGGPGIYMFYAYGTNTVRFNIAINNGLETGDSSLKSELSVVASVTTNVDIYQNTLICMKAGCVPIMYPNGQAAYGTNHIVNNILCGSDGNSLYWNGANTVLCGNDYWNQSRLTMTVYWQGTTYTGLYSLTNSTLQDAAGFAQNISPMLMNRIPSVTNGNAATIKALTNWDVSYQSALMNAGQDIAFVYGLNLGGSDFHGSSIPLPYYNIGATLTGGGNFGFTNLTGIVADWKMTNGSGTTLTDSSGNGHTGTIYNNPGWGGYCLGLTASSHQYADVGNGAALIATPWTYAAWVYVMNTSGDHDVIGGAASGHPEFLIYNNGQLGLNSQYTAALGYSTGPITFSQWQFVAVSYDGSGNFTFYINGASSGTTTDLVTFSNSDMLLGKNGSGNNLYFNGYLGETWVFSRALSAWEVYDLYNWSR